MVKRNIKFTLAISLLFFIVVNIKANAESLRQHSDTTAFCTVELFKRKFISSYAHAPITKAPHEHMKVEKGESIFSLDPQFLQLEMLKSKAKESAYKSELRVQQTKLQRYTDATSPLISDQEISEIQNQVNLLGEKIKVEKIQQQELETYIANSVLRAPSDGTIINIKKHSGMWANRGELLAEFVSDKHKELRCRLPIRFAQEKQMSVFSYLHSSIKQLEYHRTSINVDDGQAVTVYLSVDTPSASRLKLGQILTINISAPKP